MSALQVVVRQQPKSNTNGPLSALYGVLDVVVDGVNLTARVGAGQALDFLVELSHGLAGACARGRCAVPLHTDEEVWELGIEADSGDLWVCVFSPGPVTAVAAFEKRIPLLKLRDALALAIDTALTETNAIGLTRLGLTSARKALLALPEQAPPRCVRATVAVSHKTRKPSALHIAASCSLRRALGSERGGQIERADLHSLLFEGELVLHRKGHRLAFGQSQVFLDTERLLHLAEDALESWTSARPTFRRSNLSRARLCMRRGPGESALELRFSDIASQAVLALDVDCEDFAAAVARFALALVAAICKGDPSQRWNLRLRSLGLQGRALLDRINAGDLDRSKTNPEPDSYRRFSPRLRRAAGVWEQGPRMRFSPRWVASVPNIDLRATFLCGDRLLVGGAQDTACLDRRSGEVLWQRPLRAAACVVTPSGLVRVEPDGRLNCHRLEDGEPRFTLKVTPRAAGGAAGSVLHGAGLPKLLALCEGDRQVTGIDLIAGAVRWRYTAKRPAPYRIRRAGRLLITAGGDPLMVALDGLSGEVVWSLRGRLPFSADLALDHDSGFALSGTPGGSYRLHRFNPWSGEECWSVELDERPLPGHAPLLTPNTVVIPTFDQEGAGARAFDRATGKVLWDHGPGLVSTTSAWLSVDDCVVANSKSGVLTGMDASSGSLRYNHVFSSGTSADQPRRFEPVLRSGALFVPQAQVHVVRPRDGELLGTLPSDLIPDLIRVDERCDVYLAEESGHLAAFGAGTRLAVVR